MATENVKCVQIKVKLINNDWKWSGVKKCRKKHGGGHLKITPVLIGIRFDGCFKQLFLFPFGVIQV